MKKIIFLALNFMLGILVCAQDDSLQINLQSLVDKKSFAFFDHGLSHDKMQLLENLTITRTMAINNYGHLDTLESEIVDFLKSLGNNEEDAQAAAIIIYNLVMNSIISFDGGTAWVALRAFTPNELYELPRWHTDGAFYQSKEMLCYKIAYILQGPTTLFLRLPAEIRAQFFEIQSKTFRGMTSAAIKSLSRPELDALTRADRIKLVELVKDFQVYTVPADKGVIFVTGDRKRAGIHSEPAMHKNRLFLSIVPGTYEQIQEWFAKQ
jgi:hypothetical protein